MQKSACAERRGRGRRRVIGVAAAVALSMLAAAGALPAAPESDGELILGVFPRRNASELVGMFGPLAEHLARELDRPVRLETTPDFDSFWKAVGERRYHIVHYNQYHYVRSHKQQGYRVIAKNEEDGRSTIAGVIVVRRDSGIRRLQDLRNRKIVFGGNEHAMGSYIMPTYMLRRAGLGPGDYRAEFALNPPNVALAVYFRQADAGGSGDIVFNMPFVRDKVDVSQMMNLATSAPMPHLPWAVRADLPAAERDRIQRALLAVRDAPDGPRILRAAVLTDLVAATDGEYDAVREVIFAVNGERY